MAVIPVFPAGFISGKKQLMISSDYKMRQLPGEKKPRMHHGVDIAIPVGTAINSPVDGKVVKRAVQKSVNGSPAAGLYLAIEFEADSVPYYVLFMHLHEAKVALNQHVKVGDLIALSGGAAGDPNAGSSRGPHLHLEIRKGKNTSACSVDPKYWFLAQHTLTLKATGGCIYNADPTRKSFESKEMRTQTTASAAAVDKAVVWSETEYSVPKKKKISKSVTERLAPGIWQITKLLIDSSVEGKQVVDTGISTQTGSLLNFFRNVCQEPLVEFSGDTFVNQYYWMVRRPPFDKEGLKKMMELTMIDIDKADIINTDLEWNTEGIYSWYQYIPYYDLMGIKELTNVVPAVFFSQFAQVWGSKPMVVQSNYYSYIQSGRFNNNKSENASNGNEIIKNAVRDFKYIIECNAYNAFTRKGTIVIQGDRRIKRGTLIYLSTSGEIFYVEGVSNSYSVTYGGVTRTTTLQVSHGIYPNYIDGEPIGMEDMSYFNIIDWGAGFDIEKITAKNWTSFISKWKVNDEVFNFFMAKQQLYFEHMKAEGGSKYGSLNTVTIIGDKKKSENK